jgi:hypothetical protein
VIGQGYLAAGALLMSIAAGGAGYFHGVDVGRDRAASAQQAEIDRANAERDRLRAQIQTAAIKHMQADQARQATNREIIRESSQIVERPVYRAQCLDPDGVRLLDRAATAANGANRAAAPPGDAAGAAEGQAKPGGDERGPVPRQPD